MCAFQQVTQCDTVIMSFLFNIDKQGYNDLLCHTVYHLLKEITDKKCMNILFNTLIYDRNDINVMIQHTNVKQKCNKQYKNN